MKIVNEVPKSGNFIAVWEYGGATWSDSFLITDDLLYVYEKIGEDGEMIDDWVATSKFNHPAFYYDPPGGVSNRCYIVKE